ncbi:MAG: DUF1818 family protein [Cyanobium sp.]|nr:DUF1818 family protein [Cyanobium sp.]
MQVQEGPGWRFGIDPQRRPFPVLIGGDGWAAELSPVEIGALRDGALALAAELARLDDRLMPEEWISLELEREGLWLELEGRGGELALRFVLRGGPSARGLEGSWTVAATAAVLAQLAQFDPALIEIPAETSAGIGR